MTDFTVKNKILFLHVSNIIFPFITLFTFYVFFLEYAEINEQTTTTDNEEHHFFVLSSLF